MQEMRWKDIIETMKQMSLEQGINVVIHLDKIKEEDDSYDN